MLTVFGVAALTFMMMMYALEARGRTFILAFAFGCALSSVYGFLSATWPFGAVEAIWTIVALRHWHDTAGARVETGRTDTHKGAHSTRHGRTAAAGEAAHFSVNKVDSEQPQLLATHLHAPDGGPGCPELRPARRHEQL